MLPEIDLGPITLQSFGLMLGLAFVCSGCSPSASWSSSGIPPTGPTRWCSPRWSAASWAPAAWSIVENWDEAKDDLLGSIFSGTGLVFYGGAIGGAIAVALWAWWRGVFGARMFDVAAPSLAIGYAVGRIGCQLAGDGDYGVAVGRAVGDGLSRRHGADHGGGAPDAGLRDRW